MQKLNYNRLLKIVQTEKPYARRDTVDYPVLERKHSYKTFTPRLENGVTVFDIVYGTRTQREEILNAEHERDAKANGYQVFVEPNKNGVMNTDRSRFYYPKYPNILGIVRPDNTFEFTAKELHQGSSGYLAQMFSRDDFVYAYINTSSRHGGVIMRAQPYQTTKDNNNRIFHPVFRGLRFNTKTLEPHESSRYEVNVYRVNRKASKDYMLRYETLFKVTETMMKAMDQEHFYRAVFEILFAVRPDVEEGFKGLYYYCSFNETERKVLTDKAEELMESAPFDSFVLYGLGANATTPLSSNSLRTVYQRLILKQNPGYYDAMRDPVVVYEALKRRFTKDIYSANPEVMKKVRHESGKTYPPSTWGISILVNNKEVEQY